MTALELTNIALNKIGNTLDVASLSEASREADLSEKQYDHHLRACLRSFDWPFATKYAALLLTAGPLWDDDATLTLVQTWLSTDTYAIGDVVRRSSLNYYCIAASTNNQPPNATYWAPAAAAATEPPEYANGDWVYAYREPSDCLKQRRLVDDGVGRGFSATPIEFRKGTDANGLLIYTDQQAGVLEYTAIDCDNLWADDLFLDFFTWRLAAAFAPALSRNGLTAVDCTRMAMAARQLAATVAMQEGQQHKDGDAGWIGAR